MQSFADPVKVTPSPAARLLASKSDLPVKENQVKSYPSLSFQPKLKVGSADDPLEKEADAMADKVMRMEVPGLAKFSSIETNLHRSGMQNEEEKKKLQRKENHQQATSVVPPIVYDVINSSGSKSLDEGTRSFMEPRFGSDFSNVKIHDSGKAAESAGSVNALAYTVGNNIVFNSGQYNPSSDSGKRLLAHELTHVQQQQDHLNSKIRRAKDDKLPDKTPAEKEIQEVNAGTFNIPDQKGEVNKVYEAKRKDGKLATVFNLESDDGGIAFKAARSGSGKLKEMWKEKIKWYDVDRKKIEKSKTSTTDLAIYDYVTEALKGGHDIDHIVELQLGGTDTIENLQLLESEANQKAGRDIYQNLRTIALTEAAKLKVRPKQIKLNFTGVSGGTSKPTGKNINPYNIEEKFAALYDKVVGEKLSDENTSSYPIKLKSDVSEIRTPKDDAKAEVKLFGSQNAANNSAAKFIPLMRLIKLQQSKDHIEGEIDPSNKAHLPIVLKETKGHEVLFSVDSKSKGELKLARKSKLLHFYYPYLSEGAITKLEFDPQTGLKGEGYIIPSIPILNKMKLEIRFSEDEFEIVSKIDPKHLRIPIPGAKITKAEIGLKLYPDFIPSGVIEFEIAHGEKKMLEASITVGKNEAGINAFGKFNVHLPGIDKAEGTINYGKSGDKYDFSGQVLIQAESIKLKYIKSGQVLIQFANSNISADGKLILDIPHSKGVEVSLLHKNNRWLFAGSGELEVPKLKPVSFKVSYDGEKVEAEGKTGFKLFNAFDGTIELKYDGTHFSGEGEVSLKKGKATGNMKVKLGKNGKFSGEGAITYQITPSLLATAGVKIDEQEKITIIGVIEVTKPVRLFDARQYNPKFFSISLKIPVPGASIGPIGLQVVITAAAGADVGFGPGEIQNIKIASTMSPFEESPDIDFTFDALLVIPGHAGLYASIDGKISIDAWVASVSGGLTIIGSAGLKGGLSSALHAHYSKGKFSISNLSKIEAALVLGLKVDAHVEAEAGVGPFKVTTEKVWNLKSLTYSPPGAHVIISFPIEYDSDKPFKFPSEKELKVEFPEIDKTDLLSHSLKSGGAEKEK